MGRRVNHNRLSLHLLRHGETELSREDRFCSAIDADLTDAGRRMAEAFTACWAHHLTRPSWRAIYTSARRRTIDTAAPFAAAVGIRPIIDRGLEEIDRGDWQGRTKQEIARDDPETLERWLADPTVGAPAGESARDVARRAIATLQRICSANAGGDILIVGHKTWLRLLICLLTGVELRHYRERIPQPVGGHSVLELEGRRWVLRRLADRSHLPPELCQPGPAEAVAARPRRSSALVVPAGTAAPQTARDLIGEQQAGGRQGQAMLVHDQPAGARAPRQRLVTAVEGVAAIADPVDAAVDAVEGA
jgi:probable phosphoglycerate mutase